MITTANQTPSTILRALREEYGNQLFNALFNIPLRQLNAITRLERSRETAHSRKE